MRTLIFTTYFVAVFTFASSWDALIQLVALGMWITWIFLEDEIVAKTKLPPQPPLHKLWEVAFKAIIDSEVAARLREDDRPGKRLQRQDDGVYTVRDEPLARNNRRLRPSNGVT